MRLSKMTTRQVAGYFENNDTVLLAVGSIENHGSHNVLGVDTLVPERILELIEQRSDILIAPTMPYGACDYLADFPGTITLGHDVLYAVLTKIVEGLYAHGARHFIFLNGHGGNIPALERVSLDLSKRGALGAILNWWLMAWDLDAKWKGGHGGGEETSAMLAVDPSLVYMDDIRGQELINDLGDHLPSVSFKGVRFEGIDIPVMRSDCRVTSNGWIGSDDPSDSTREWGVAMLQAVADYTVRFIPAFARAKLS